MRQKEFLQQLTIDCVPIAEIEIPKNRRSHLDNLLAALQHIYMTPKWNKKVFEFLEKEITKTPQNTGRPGMSLWEIFVLSQVKLGLNISYDDLHHRANCNSRLRGIMGVHKRSIGFGSEKQYSYQTILDNIKLLSEEFLKELNDVIVKIGHEVFKKKNTQSRLKTDSFVVETATHFPTDYNLLYDSVRKSIEKIEKLKLPGWRKSKNWKKSLKGLMREFGKVSSSGGKNKTERLKTVAEKYLKKSKSLSKKIEEALLYDYQTEQELSILLELSSYHNMLLKHIDLLERRIIKEERIPHEEKIFSIFQPFVEFINKGKRNVEIGKKVAITTDETNLIIDWQIAENQTDNQLVVPIMDRILKKYKVKSASFDKGFSSKADKELLSLYIEQVIMPKKGKRTKEEKLEESKSLFKRLKNKHSAVESNINELESRGLNRCRDRSYKSFKTYVSLACTAYNLHKIGRELNKQPEKNHIINPAKLSA